MVSSTKLITPDENTNPKSAPPRAREMNGGSDHSDISSPEDNSDMDLLAKLEAMQRKLQEQEDKIANQEKKMKEEEEARIKSEQEMKKRMDDEKKEMKRKEQERIKELMRQEEERMKELKQKEEELQRKEEERMAEIERERQMLEARERDIGEREERISILENRSELGETDTESEIGAHGRKGRRWPKAKDVCELNRHSKKAHDWPSAKAVCELCGRSSVPDSHGTNPCGCLETGFECCVQYQHNECNCSYSCKFVKEYFEDSKELTNEEMKQLSSEWSERRRLSLVEKEKRKEEEAEAQKEMWRRVQEMMSDD